MHRDLEVEFPYLQVTTRDGHTALVGDLPLVIDGRVVDSFEIEVIIPHRGPRVDIPSVRETAGRVPPEADRHMDPSTGKACLFVREEYWFKHPDGLDLIAFLRGPVRSFFIGQMSVERGGGWPFGQRSHGAQGIIEFYAPLLGTDDRRTVRRYVEVIAAKKARAHWGCPCGSGKALGACHSRLIRELRARIPRRAAAFSLTVLQRTSTTRAT